MRFRSRRLFRNMQLMHFPRYAKRQMRDFFYLSERTVLPGRPLAGAFEPEGAEGRWQLPQPVATGFPYSIATTWLRPRTTRPEAKVRLMQLDLQFVDLVDADRVPDGTVLALALPEPSGAAPQSPAPALWVSPASARAAIAEAPPAGEDWHRLLPAGPARRARAAWGIVDGHVAVYGEVVTARRAGADFELVAEQLRRLGAEQVMPAPEMRLAIGGATDLAGHPSRATGRFTSTRYFVRRERLASRPLFPETPVVAYEHWKPLQP